MKTSGMPRHPLSILLIACAVISMLLSACQPANVTASQPPAQPTATQLPAQAPTEKPAVMATQEPAQPTEPVAVSTEPAAAPTEQAAEPTQPPAEATQPPANASGGITLDLSGAAQGMTVETVASVAASADRPFWEVAPVHRVVTLEGYPVTGHMMKPQIFIYPAADLAGFNEAAGGMVTDLQALIQSQKPGNRMPFLPLFNAAQVMHAQVQYLDFKNGKGVRFLTQFDQGPLPINNTELIYTFQGLTSDGKYYIAAVLPVTHPDLPNDQKVNEADINDFPAYLAKTVAMLDGQPTASFTPDLAKLDALIQSIEVK